MNMQNIAHFTIALVGPTELWIILAIVIVLFGASKIPQLMRGVGKGISEFKQGINEGKELENKINEGNEPENKQEDQKKELTEKGKQE